MMFRTSRFRLLFSCLALLVTAPVGAYNDEEQDRNHPEVVWKTAETEHFRFHYAVHLREVAEACASRAEAVYPEVTQLFGHEPSSKIDFLVMDADYSNGWAIASLNTMSIWSADLGFNLRGSKGWIRDVVAHEFAHVISIQTSSKFWPWLTDVQLGWGDASSSRIASGGWLVWSLNPYSMSLAEGTAQWSSEKMGGDRWDTHRRMILRTAALQDSLLPWSRLTSFSGSGLDFERVYNHGYGLVRHVAQTRGPDAVRQWWQALGRWDRQTAGTAWKAVDGQSGSALWREWRDSMRTVAEREQAAALPLVQGRKLFGQAFNTLAPRWWDDSTLLFSSNRGSDFQVNSLWGCRLTRADSAKRFWVAGPTIRTQFSVDATRQRIWFYSGRNNDAQGQPIMDIYSSELKSDDEGNLEAEPRDQQLRLTKEFRALVPEVRGESLLVVSREKMGFRLHVLNSSGVNSEDARDSVLWPRPDSLGQVPVVQIYQARWLGNTRKILMDWFDGQLRRVDILDEHGALTQRLGDSTAEWRDPVATPDGQMVILVSDRTGIFNLYRQNLSDGSLEQLTSVVGGAFQPAVSPNGKQIAYSQWDNDGYSLYLLDSVVVFPVRTAETRVANLEAPQEQTWDLGSREESYSPIPRRFLVSPIGYAQRNADVLGVGNPWNFSVGGRMQLLDPVRRNTLYFLGLLDVSHGFDYFSTNYRNLINPAQEKTLLAGWENRSWWPTFNVDLGYQSMRGEDTASVYNGRTDQWDRQLEEFALHVFSGSASARYSVTDNQKVHASLGWMGYDFDFYQAPFRFSAYSSWSPSVFWSYLKRDDAGNTDGSDPRGHFARIQWRGEQADLARTGSFADVFKTNSDGSVSALTNRTRLHRLYADFREGFGNPLLPSHGIELDASAAAILGYDAPGDTLNSFYLEGLSLPGYPDLAPGSREERLFQGTTALSFSVNYRLPIWELRQQWGIWFADTWSTGFGVYAGRAWTDQWNGNLSESIQDFSRSATWESRLSGTLHSSYPFQLFVRAARAFDEPQGLRQSALSVAGVPTGIHRLEFGLNLGLDEWAIIDQSQKRQRPLLPLPPAPLRSR